MEQAVLIALVSITVAVLIGGGIKISIGDINIANRGKKERDK